MALLQLSLRLTLLSLALVSSVLSDRGCCTAHVFPIFSLSPAAAIRVDDRTNFGHFSTISQKFSCLGRYIVFAHNVLTAGVIASP